MLQEMGHYLDFWQQVEAVFSPKAAADKPSDKVVVGNKKVTTCLAWLGPHHSTHWPRGSDTALPLRLQILTANP